MIQFNMVPICEDIKCRVDLVFDADKKDLKALNNANLADGRNFVLLEPGEVVVRLEDITLKEEEILEACDGYIHDIDIAKLAIDALRKKLGVGE